MLLPWGFWLAQGVSPHRDTGTWPAERTYAVFRKWFDVRLYPLIQDLVADNRTLMLWPTPACSLSSN